MPEPTRWPSSYPIEIVAGSGEQGFQDGPALQASFSNPGKPCLDPRDGSLYIPDTHLLRKLTPDGRIITVAGGQEAGYKDGPAPEARFDTIRACGVDAQGNVLLLDLLNRRLRQLTPSGKVSTLIGTGENKGRDGNQEQAAFTIQLRDLTFLPSGELIIVDGWRVRRYVQGMLETLNRSQSSGADQGPVDGELATEARFGDGLWISSDPEGNVYLADQDIRALRRIDPQRKVTTLTPRYEEAEGVYGLDAWKHAFSAFPHDVVFDSSRKQLYTVDSGINIFQVSLDGNMNLVAGNSMVPKAQAPFSLIRFGSLVMGKDKNLYVIDHGSRQLKRVLLPPP